MKNKLKILGIILLTAMIGLSFTACDPEIEAITVNITGDFSSYAGWKAGVQLSTPDTTNRTTLAYTNYVNVTNGATSLSFALFADNTLSTPYDKEGNYFIAFWFEKNGEDDADYYIESRQLNKGVNTIQFSSFTSLQSSGINLTITNNTGYTVDEIYVSLSSSLSWGSNRLGVSESLATGASKTITLSAGTYDIRLVDSDEYTYTKYDESISSNKTVTFTFDDYDVNNGGGDDYSDLYGTWKSDASEYFSLVIQEGYIYFVSSHPMGGNTYSLDIISYEGTTMTLENSEQFTVYINQSGKLVISGSDGGYYDGTYTNEDDYIFSPNAAPLLEGIWQRSYLESSDPVEWFEIYVLEGKTCNIYINDSDWINDFITDVTMDIYFNGTLIGTDVDLRMEGAWGECYSYTADEDGTIYVKVYGSQGGEFDIGFNFGTDKRAYLVWPLADSGWIAGNFEYADELQYVFIAEPGVTYNIWWDDYDQDDNRIDIVVSAYLKQGEVETVLFEYEDESDASFSFTVTGTGTVNIYVNNLTNLGNENFEISFSTNGQKPPKG